METNETPLDPPLIKVKINSSATIMWSYYMMVFKKAHYEYFMVNCLYHTLYLEVAPVYGLIVAMLQASAWHDHA